MHQSASSQTPPSSSPFTNTPLPQRTHISPPPHHTAQQQPYGAFAYPYGAYAGYPGYTAFSARPPTKPTPVASTSFVTKDTTAASKTAAKTTTSAGTGKDKDTSGTEEGSDAWVAAQHILKAINFGSLQDNTTSNTSPAITSAPNNATVDTSHAVPPPVVPTSSIDIGVAPEDDGLGRATLTDEERASLQAQLALLAAQLGEIAATDEAEDDDATGETDEEAAAPPSQLDQRIVAQTVADAPKEKTDPGSSIVMDVNQFPEGTESSTIATQQPSSAPIVPTTQPETPAIQSGQNNDTTPSSIPPMGGLQYPEPPKELEAAPPKEPRPEPIVEPASVEESDEDEDMEMVDVDSYVRNSNSEGLRT